MARHNGFFGTCSYLPVPIEEVIANKFDLRLAPGNAERAPDPNWDLGISRISG